MADVVQHSLNVDSKQVEDALVRLTVAFKAPQDKLLELTTDLNALNTETAKVVVTSKALGEGLVNITASLKAPATDAAQLSSRMLDVANSTKLAADALKNLTQVEQQKRGVQISAAVFTDTALAEQKRKQIFAEALQAEKANLADRLALAKNTLAQINNAEEQHLQRVLARGRIVLNDYLNTQQQMAASAAAGRVQNRAFDVQQTPMNQFVSIMGGKPFADIQRDLQTTQASLAPFAAAVLSNPVQALKVLATDSRAAGAAMQFLRGELNFIAGSRFGAIAIGFAVFGTIEETIRRTIGALVEFEAKFARVEALSVGMANAVNINARAQQFVFEAALKTGIELGELADKYLVAASATNSETTAQGLFTNALRFSTATGADFKASLLLLSGVLNTYGDTLGSSLTETEKLQVLTSKLFATFKISRGEANDFVQALKFVSASAKISNISIDSLLGVLGGLADKMQEGSRGGRGFGQVLTTIIREAGRFNEAFNLGLSKREIIEAPLAALEKLREQIQGGTLDVTRFTAETADLFPQNASRVFLSMMQLTTEEVRRYTDEIKKAVDIQRVADKALENTQVQWGILKRVAELSIAAMFNGSKDLGELMKTVLIPTLAIFGQGFILIMADIRLILAAAIGVGSALAAWKEGNLREARFLLKATKDEMADIIAKASASVNTLENLGKGFDDAAGKVRPYKDILAEANEAMEKSAEAEKALAAARVSRGERGIPLGETQQLELDVARHLTVELDKQIGIKERAVRLAEQASREALTIKDADRARSELLSALRSLETTRLDALKDANEKILLQSEQLTEKQRSQAVVTQEFAAQEIAARRGIIAALQGEQAQVEALAEARQISAKEASRQLVQLQREQNAQLQLIKSVAESANKADKERLEAAKRLREAQDKIADSEQAVVKAKRAQDDQRRITIETEAAGQSRILLATQLDATDSVLKQLDVVRAAQEIANLPLKERIQLLEQERGLLDKLKSTEQQRLELEIEFGSQLPKLLAAQERFARRVLQDPVRREAAEKAAALAGNPTDEGVIHEVAKARQLRELAVFTAGDRKKEVEALKGQNDLRIKQEQAFNEQLATQLSERAKVEQEAAATTAKAIREAAQSLADQQGLFDKQNTIGPRPPLPDLFHRDVQVYILPDGSFTNVPPITSPPVKAFPLPATPSESLRLLPQSLPEQDTILQEFRRGVQDISLGLADDLVSPFRQAREQVQLLKADLQTLGAAIPEVVSRSGTSLIDMVEEKLTDRIARELAFPTWT